MSHDINTSNAGPISATVSPAKLRILLTCGVIAGSLFVGVTVLQALTRDGFDLSPHRLPPAELWRLGLDPDHQFRSDCYAEVRPIAESAAEVSGSNERR